MTRPASERRRHPRVRVDLPLSLSFETQETEVQIKDLSLSGVCCRTPFEMNEMTQVQIAMELPMDEPASIEIRGVVVRCEPIEDQEPPIHDLAIFFTEFQGESQQRLAEYLHGQLATQPVG
ncbi:MAG: PilZ domain-containing protein [Planctomycetota bacterium]